MRFGRLSLSETELKNHLGNTTKIVSDVAETHFGLGHRAAFLDCMNQALLGCLQVGTMGIGKTMCLRAIQSASMEASGCKWKPVKSKERRGKLLVEGKKAGKKWAVVTEEFTLASINDRLNKLFSDKRITWISKDLAKLSPTVQENMLKVASSLISDHECIVSTSLYQCNIQNSNVSWLGACTYEVFNELMDSNLWRGMYQDRIMRYHAFQYKPKYINPNEPVFRNDINLSRDPPIVTKDAWFKRVVSMLEMQFTYERSVEYAERLLQGVAIQNNKDKVYPAYAKFILLHSANVGAESYIAWRNTISSPLVVDTDALLILSEAVKRGKVKVSFLAKKYHTDEEHIRDSAVEYEKILRLTDGGNIVSPTPLILRGEKENQKGHRGIQAEDFGLPRKGGR